MWNRHRHLCLLLSVCLTFIYGVELSTKYESLSHIYETYDEGPGLSHYRKYGPAYDENIHQLREKAVISEKKVKMLEIGIQSGGSTRVWKRYFRGTLAYTGVDINPRCKQFDSPSEGITIEIGSQLNKTFLSYLCTTYGPFDLVVDDGGHTNEMIMTTLLVLWRCLSDNAVYVIEDLHTLNFKGVKFLKEGEVDVFQRLAGWEKVRSPRGMGIGVPTDHPGWHLKKLSFYDSMLFLFYGEKVGNLGGFKKGDHWVPHLYSKDTVVTKRCVGCCVGCYDD